MKDIKIWIRTDDTPESVQDFALRLLQEDERYCGDFQIVIYNPGKVGTEKLSHIFNLSDFALSVLCEHYGDDNVWVASSGVYPPVQAAPERDPLERIADAVESLADMMDSIGSRVADIESHLDDLSCCVGTGLDGGYLAIRGTVGTREV